MCTWVQMPLKAKRASIVVWQSLWVVRTQVLSGAAEALDPRAVLQLDVSADPESIPFQGWRHCSYISLAHHKPNSFLLHFCQTLDLYHYSIWTLETYIENSVNSLLHHFLIRILWNRIYEFWKSASIWHQGSHLTIVLFAFVDPNIFFTYLL